MTLPPRLGAFALLAVMAAAAADAPENALPNGDFEEGMTGWTASARGGQDAGAAVDGRCCKSGAQSLKLSVAPNTGVTIRGAAFEITAGSDYLFSLWTRAEGFSKTTLYEGVNAQYWIGLLDAEGKHVGRVGAGFSYGPHPEWRRWLRLFAVPANVAAAELHFAIGAREDGLPSQLWIDRVRVQRWDGEVKPDGQSWTFRISDGYFTRDTFRRAADDDAECGFAVIANTRFVKKTGYLAGGIYFRGLPPGQYCALYRMKVADLSGETPVVALDVNPQHGGHGNARTVTTADFAQPNAYQDVPMRFVVAPDAGYVDFRAAWQGQVTTWIDTITVREEEIYSDERIKTLFE